MADPTPAERAVRSREVEGRGIPSSAGNPGKYAGDVEVSGRRYAKFTAEPGTWVSSSMKTMGYDEVYPARDGYGAYHGLVLDPQGKPLADPDRIRPGDQYLVPERTVPEAPVTSTTPATPVRTAPLTGSPPDAPAYAARATPVHLDLRPAPETVQRQAGASRERVPDDVEREFMLKPSEREEIERLLNDPSSDALVGEEVRHLALEGIDEAMTGRREQEEFGSGDNSLYAFVNDWVSDRSAPSVVAWHNTAMLFRRMLEQAESGNVDGALLTGRLGAESLADAQAGWEAYQRENLRLGELMIGTAEEVRRTGAIGNLRLAGMGLGGGVAGAGKRLSEFAAGVVAFAVDPGRATYHFVLAVKKVVDTAVQLGRAYSRDPAEFMPKVIEVLSRQSHDSLERLSRLPPDQQAWAVGGLFGEVEGDLMLLAAAKSLEGPARSLGPASSGLGGARGLESMRGLALADGGVVVASGANAATSALVDVVQVAGFLSAFAVAAGPVAEGEAVKYGDYSKRGRGTGIEGHEVIPHSLLEDLGLAIRRGVGAASKDNPTLGVSRELHAILGRYQRYFGVMYRSQRKGMLPSKIISLNIKALRGAGVPESVVVDVTRQVLRFRRKYKIK